MSPATLGALDPTHFISPMAVPGDGSTASMPHQPGCSTPGPCPSTGPAAPCRVPQCSWPCGTALQQQGEEPGWAGCNAPCPIQAPQDPCPLAGRALSPTSHPFCLCLTLVSPSPRAHQCLLWLCLLTGLAVAGPAPPPPPQPFISSAVGLHHITQRHTHAPGSGTAAATCVPAVPTATSSCGHLRRLKPLTPRPGCVPIFPMALRILAARCSVPLVPQSLSLQKPPVPFPRLM